MKTKNLRIIIVLLVISTFLRVKSYGQTKELELDNMTKKYQNKELSLEKYMSNAKVWQDLIINMGGYPELPFDTNSGLIKFEYVIKTNTTKQVTYNRILEWGALTFGALSSVLHYEDLESGKIILKGSFDVTHKKSIVSFWGNMRENYVTTTCYQTYIFTIKEKKIKLQINNIIYEYNYSGYSTGGTYAPARTIKIPMTLLYPITNFKSTKWKENLDMLRVTNIKTIGISKNIEDYVNGYIEDYNF